MACPSQWDAWDTKGNYYYLRYRHGYGEVRQYKTANWVDAPWKENVDETEPGWSIRANTEYIRTVTEFQHGDPLDGWIELPEFCQLAGIELAENLMNTNFGDYLRDALIMEGVIGLADPGTELAENHDPDQDEEQHGPEERTTP